MSQAGLIASLLEAIHQPVPIESALDHDLYGLLEWLDQSEDPREFIANLFLNEGGKILVDHTPGSLLRSDLCRRQD